MSLTLLGLRHLMRGSKGLPINMSETEVKHYASEVLRRLQRGEDIEQLEVYLRGINASGAGRFRVSVGTYDLARKAHLLFNTTADGPLR